MRCVNCGGEMKMHGFKKSGDGKTMKVRYLCIDCKHEKFEEEDIDE